MVEIAAGLGVAIKPRYGAYVRGRLARSHHRQPPHPSGYYDVALRDFGLILGALTLARLASKYDPPGPRAGR